MSDVPLVSIIIPVYNRSRYLDGAIDSVLGQSHTNLEIVVVDDGSTDGAGDRAEERSVQDARITVLHRPHLGVSAARNAGIERSRGDYIGFLDADDWLLQDTLHVQVGALEAHPEADLVYSEYRLMLEADGSVRDPGRGVPPRPFPEILHYRNWFAIMAALVRRRLVDEVGGFDTAMRGGEDWDFWYRCAQRGTFLFVPGVAGFYRQHAEQSHRQHQVMEEGRRTFARKHFRDDPTGMRRCMSYYYLQDAKYQRAQGNWVACCGDLARYLWAARSPREARFVWELP